MVLIKMLRCLEMFKQHKQWRSTLVPNHAIVICVWAEAERRLPLFFFTFKFHQHLHYLEPGRGTLVVTGGLSVARMLPFEREQYGVKKLGAHGKKHTAKSTANACDLRTALEWIRATAAEEYGMSVGSSDWSETPAYLWADTELLDITWLGTKKPRTLSPRERQTVAQLLRENGHNVAPGMVDPEAESYQRVRVGSTTFRVYSPTLKTDKSIFKFTWTDARPNSRDEGTGTCYARCLELLQVDILEGAVDIVRVDWFGTTNEGRVSNLIKLKPAPRLKVKFPWVMLSGVWQGHYAMCEHDDRTFLINLSGQGRAPLIRDNFNTG